MAYIFGIVVVGLFFLVLHYFTELDKKQKTIVTSFVLVVILGAIAFNTYSSSQREVMLNAVRAFNQNKTITCDGVDVNKTNFTLSVGTYTFIGKKDTPFYEQMISASKCK
jgi:hypothetical protein